ncbi:MAG: hypothetical protein U0527_16385 [Candidatus Eisenbacteria bacterium]
MKSIARIKEAWPAACCSLGLVLFVLALLLIAVFWPFGGGLAQTFVVDQLAGDVHAGASPVERLWRHWIEEAQAETQLVAPTDVPSALPKQPAATQTPGLENAIYRVWILAGVAIERSTPAGEPAAVERVSI